MNRPIITHLTALAAVALLLFGATQAFAGGTDANTLIENLATLQYTVNGVPQDEIESNGGVKTTFRVDHKIRPLVTNVPAVGPDKLTPNQTDTDTQWLKFTVKNDGNSTQNFKLTFQATGSTLTPALNDVIIVLDNGDGTYDDSTDGTADLNNTSISFSKDAERTYFIVARDTAATLLNGQVATYHLIATAVDGAGADLVEAGSNSDNTADIVFADEGGSYTGDNAFGGFHSASGTFTVQTATLTVTKTATVFDTGSGLPSDTYAIPGAIVTYSIRIQNAAGAQSASGITLIDEIPDNTSFVVGSVTNGAAVYANETTTPFDPAASAWGETPVADANGVDTDVTAIKVTTADIAAEGDLTVTFKVKIN